MFNVEKNLLTTAQQLHMCYLQGIDCIEKAVFQIQSGDLEQFLYIFIGQC